MIHSTINLSILDEISVIAILENYFSSRVNYDCKPEVQLLHIGVTNHYYKIDCGDHSYMMRILSPNRYTLASMKLESSFVRFAVSNGVSIEGNFKSDYSDDFISVDFPEGQRYISLMNFLEENHGLNDFYVAGQVLANLHMTSLDFNSRYSDGDRGYMYANKDDESPFYTDEKYGMLREMSHHIDEQLEEYNFKSLPTGLIHGDFKLNNTMTYGNKVALINLKDVQCGPFLLDIASFLHSITDMRLYALYKFLFLRGYKSVRRLDANEKKALPLLIKRRHIDMIRHQVDHNNFRTLESDEHIDYLIQNIG